MKKIIEKYGIYLGFIAILIAFTILSPYFLKVKNFSNIIVQSSIIAIIAIGSTIVILTGGIELSVGSTVAFCSLFSALLIVKAGIYLPVAIILSLLAACLVGFVNGFIISYGRVPAFITTLGTMSIIRGVALAVNKGQPIANMPNTYQMIANYELFGVIPIFIVYIIVAYVLAYFFLKYTKAGRYIYAIGGNRDAARLSGIRVKNYEVLAYTICGLVAGIGGILLTARLDYATPLAGMGYELDVIAATVIGGTSLSGGTGNIWGTLLGALIMVTLRNGLTLLNVQAYYQQIIIGSVIIVAVFLDKVKTAK